MNATSVPTSNNAQVGNASERITYSREELIAIRDAMKEKGLLKQIPDKIVEINDQIQKDIQKSQHCPKGGR